ncbi:MAG TPA: glycoside hydrolase family 2 TIM barrel-domain containing protein, partial [Opitutales bacterium]|nr:glycoside hydrolase family 2 TIM barrel-domain containing protein [Opitutales bacterium]
MKIPPGLLVVLALVALPISAIAAPAAPGIPTQTVYLSGHGSDDAVLWNFYCNDGRKAGMWSKIRVPSCWEQEGFGSYNYGYEIRGANAENAPGFARETGKYYYDFTVPADWKGKTVRIVFEGSMTDTEVQINGQSAGPIHQGSFYRFKYDITSLLKFGGSNRLTVTVSKESANASVNAAERRGDYWNFGGIFRPVYLEALPAQFIDWTAIDAQADGRFSAQVHLGAAAAVETPVTAQVLDIQGHPVGAPFSANIAAGQDVATVSADFPGVKLWSAETPNLYRVRFTLGAAGHATEEKFGFRTFEVRAGDGLYLNGQRIILKGVDRHSFWPETGRTLNRQICYDDVKLMKEANMNAVRMSHYPPDHEFLEACDELGLYVLDELGGWHGHYDTPTGQKLIGEMVRRDVNHPSILFWDNGNEGGWNAENDGEFAKWDPQHRNVIHPQARLGAINSPHYPTYQSIQQLAAGDEVFMFTEFLHGLYDGGGGTGLHDYWAVLSNAPHFGGGFIWALLDEAVARTDENGKL